MAYTKENLEKDLVNLFNEHYVIRQKICDKVNKFLDENEVYNGFATTIFEGKENSNMIDSPALLTAWLYDRLNGKLPAKQGSKTKAIRKVLGYSYP